MRDKSGKCNEVCTAKTFSGYCSLSAGCIKYPDLTIVNDGENCGLYSGVPYDPPKEIVRIDKDSYYHYLYIGKEMKFKHQDFKKIVEELKKYGG